jgi:glycosyltransferase involved in cell wall biosynthesis
MLVSIIVPVYNVEKYITRCFNSIIKQSFANIECIFVDDCSPDNSIDILHGLINEYTGNILFRILRHEKNGGLSVARNTGIKSAKGEYLYFLDSDDEITEHCIQSLVTLVERYKNVDIVQGNTIKVPCGSYNQYDITQKHFPEYTDNYLWLKKHFLLFPRIPVNLWNKLIKYNFIIKNNLYFREGIIHEDEYWMFFAAKKIESMAFTTYYSYTHYLTSGSIMRSNNAIKSLQSWLIIIQDMLENIDMEVYHEERKYIYSVLRNRMYKIKTTAEYKQLLLEYQKNIRICARNACKSLDFISYLGLLLFLFPCQVYNNKFAKILSKLLLGNWKNIFSLDWYRLKWIRFRNGSRDK